MRQRVYGKRLDWVAKIEQEHAATIKNFRFNGGDLVLARNTRVEKTFTRKNRMRYMGPLIVIRRNRGGSYVVAEMDGTVLRGKIGAFRCLPHIAQYNPIELPDNIHELINLLEEQLKTMVEEDEKMEPNGQHYIFNAIPNLRLPEDDNDD
ncbi:hypothetical protein BT96DRAFT_842475 [Gymnopus androsaceus JB14]|uniref:Uncharacterized protein n=1 Tax=Gymnopus androsaceus JB14 TaxID=1447944 RepID=A0A6A4GFE1_9AGAR|nr:hypothetical protein BT96DRAFT_842475 [Gymnopus androsaceus JB14]